MMTEDRKTVDETDRDQAKGSGEQGSREKLEQKSMPSLTDEAEGDGNVEPTVPQQTSAASLTGDAEGDGNVQPTVPDSR